MRPAPHRRRERATSQSNAGPRSPFTQPRSAAAIGRVISLNTTAPAGGDRPWWVSVVHVLAVLPGLMAMAVIVAVRMFANSLRRSKRSVSRSPFKLPDLTPKPHWSPSPALTFGGLGTLLGYRMGRASAKTEYSQLRLRSPGSEVECRYLAASASIPVAQGDELRLWGSQGRDGVLRGYRLTIACSKYEQGGGWKPWSLGAVPVALLANALSKARVARRRRGKMLVGHVRYPWVSSVGVHTANRRRGSDSLRIVLRDPGRAAERSLILSIAVPRGHLAAERACQLAGAVAHHRLDHADGQLDEASTAGLQELLEPQQLAPSPRQVQAYVFPAGGDSPVLSTSQIHGGQDA